MASGTVLLAVAIALVAAGIICYRLLAPRGADLVTLQWAGSAPGAFRKVADHQASYRLAALRDLEIAVPGYPLGLLVACYLGWRVFWTRRLGAAAVAGMAAAVSAGLLGGVADWLIAAALDQGLPGTWIFRVVQALSFAKFSALLVAGVIGALALATTLGRLVLHRGTVKRWKSAIARADARKPAGEVPLAIPPPPLEVQPAAAPPEAALRRSWWKRRSTGSRAHWAQNFALPTGPETGGTGICVSGGGIRSASVTLGALQALREEGLLAEARHLISVSGGGYTAGGFQLALMPPGGWPAGAAAQAAADGGATPADVFDAGSPEEDHLRRHSSYVAADLRQWLVALGVLLRGVTSSFIVIGLTVTTLGIAAGRFYRLVPVTENGNLAALRPSFLAPGRQHAPAFPAVPAGVWLAIGAAAALAVAGYLTLAWLPRPARGRQPGLVISRLSGGLRGGTVLLAVIGVALPALIWSGAWLSWQVKLTGAGAVTAGSLSLVLSYLGAIAATLWRNRTSLAKTSRGLFPALFSRGPVNQVLPTSMIQLILLWVCLAGLVLMALLAAGWIATSTLAQSWWALAPVGMLTILAIFLDQTVLSLHPFYRRRVASAFAVRRTAGQDGVVAQPYDYYAELTSLSRYARRREPFPAVTFAAAANIKGQQRTPSGRAAVSFTFGSDYIGGPQAGWVRTDFLEELASARIRQDLTVEAAIAISGAAFASAMGSKSSFYEVFLALSNARLGAWLPNPYFVALKLQHLDDWTIPGLPATRRLSYFAREIFGIHPGTGRMLLCTDGGHYDNLGLVELLRRRCQRVFCINASGTVPPLDDALSCALSLAAEELGVQIKFRESVYDLVPGGWDFMQPAAMFEALNCRLSRNAVIIGDIIYPAVGGLGEAQGQIVLARATLTHDMPYQLLDFTQNDPGFPRDSTADQWFDVGQFDAYQQLGRTVGQWAAHRSRHVQGASEGRPQAAGPNYFAAGTGGY
jgi:hypothetical protein